MNTRELFRVGGIAGVVFCVVWMICGTGYVLLAGIPSEPAPLADTIALMRSGPYRILFWSWPLAYLAAIPFALAVRELLCERSRAWADVGAAFLLLYSTLWFVFHASIMAGLSIANSQPVDEQLLGLTFLLTGALGSPLFWSIAIFEGAWAVALLRGEDSRGLGWILVTGAVLSMVYFIMRYTGPMFWAELIHEGLIVFMVLGVAGLSRLLLTRAGEAAGHET